MFKVGDRVRINNKTADPMLVGVEGTIIYFSNDGRIEYARCKTDKRTPYGESVQLVIQKFDLIDKSEDYDFDV